MKIKDILIKDIKKIIYDKKVLTIIILMPIVLMTILGFSLRSMFDSEDSGISDFKVAVVKTYDSDQETHRFIQFLKNNSQGNEEIETLIQDIKAYHPEKIFFDQFLDDDAIQEFMTYDIMAMDNAKQSLNNKEISAVIVLPKDYVYSTFVNTMTPIRNKVTLEVIKHPDKNFTGTIVEEIIEGYNMRLNALVIGKYLFTKETKDYVGIENALKDSALVMEQISEDLRRDIISIKDKSIYGNKNISSFQYYAAAMMAMFLFYAASNGGTLLLQETEDKTMQRLLISGVTISKMIKSNFLMIVCIALLQSIAMILYSSIVLKVTWGNPLLIVLTISLMSFAIGGLGLLISTITLATNNYRFANIFQLFIIHFMSLIGGSFLPVTMLPNFIQKINLLSINGVGIKMYMNIMAGHGLGTIVNYCLILLAMGLVFIITAFYIMKSKRRVKP